MKTAPATGAKRILDYATSVARHVRDQPWPDGAASVVQPHASYALHARPMFAIANNSAQSTHITNRLNHADHGNTARYSYHANNSHAYLTRLAGATHKERSALNCVTWAPNARRIVTGNSIGEFALWNGLHFGYEMTLTAHENEQPVRCMQWTPDGELLLSADDAGIVRYWKGNMENVQCFFAHERAVNAITCAPALSSASVVQKMATASDDRRMVVRDFETGTAEREYWHTSEVRAAAWHPWMSLVATGSREGRLGLFDVRQKPVAMTVIPTPTAVGGSRFSCSPGTTVTIPPTTTAAVTAAVTATTMTMTKPMCTWKRHASDVTQVAWNNNGLWFVTASRDQTLRLYDIRFIRGAYPRSFCGDVAGLRNSGGGGGEVSIYIGHTRDVTAVAWHPFFETLFASGGADGAINYWTVFPSSPSSSSSSSLSSVAAATTATTTSSAPYSLSQRNQPIMTTTTFVAPRESNKKFKISPSMTPTRRQCFLRHHNDNNSNNIGSNDTDNDNDQDADDINDANHDSHCSLSQKKSKIEANKYLSNNKEEEKEEDSEAIVGTHATYAQPSAQILGAHDGAVLGINWHPLGHVLASVGSDFCLRLWARNKPGDDMRDTYNAGQLPEDEKNEFLGGLRDKRSTFFDIAPPHSLSTSPYARRATSVAASYRWVNPDANTDDTSIDISASIPCLPCP